MDSALALEAQHFLGRMVGPPATRACPCLVKPRPGDGSSSALDPSKTLPFLPDVLCLWGHGVPRASSLASHTSYCSALPRGASSPGPEAAPPSSAGRVGATVHGCMCWGGEGGRQSLQMVPCRRPRPPKATPLNPQNAEPPECRAGQTQALH